MKITDLTTAEFQRYFESRLQGQKIRRSGSGYVARCPFHDDREPSLSLNFEKGVWKCHAGTNCGSGGLIDFEKKITNCDDSTAVSRIAEVLGKPQLKMGQKWEASYDYTDEYGKLLFQVVRYPGKKFLQRRPTEKGGWIWDTDKTRIVLYHLPEVITAKEVALCEGEKDADNVREAFKDLAENFTATATPRGAKNWRDELAFYFTGKKVIIFEDNDDPGRQFTQRAARAICRYACGVKVVSFPELPPHSDVSDFLKQHSVLELIDKINKTPPWKPPDSETVMFVTLADFIKQAPDSIDWLVEGVIERGSNGIWIARPKAGKSFSVLDLAISLAAGVTWLDFYVPKAVRVAVVSREDNPYMTGWRARRLCDGRGINPEEISPFFYVNSKKQTPQLMLDNEEQMNELLRNLDRLKSEFVVLDVFRRLHTAEENDNTEMQRVIDRIQMIQEKAGCQVAIIHHEGKGREDATLTERVRGAGAIAGYAEWVMGIKVVNPEDAKHEWVREWECEIKAAISPDNIFYRIQDCEEPKKGVELLRTNWNKDEQKGKYRKKVDQAVAGNDQDQENIPF